MRTVQIVGSAPSIIDWPVIEGAERWVFNASYKLDQGRPYTRVFNLHEFAVIQACLPDVWPWYAKQTVPVYLLEAHPDIPRSLPFPLKAVRRFFAHDGELESYFDCQLDLLIAFALMEGFDHIDLAGIEVRREEEWGYQRASVSYWMGRARGMGRRITAAPTSQLCTTPAIYGYNLVTGFPSTKPGPIMGHPYSMLPVVTNTLINGAYEH